ncbi:target of SBF [Saitoella coloradoensis]
MATTPTRSTSAMRQGILSSSPVPLPTFKRVEGGNVQEAQYPTPQPSSSLFLPSSPPAAISRRPHLSDRSASFLPSSPPQQSYETPAPVERLIVLQPRADGTPMLLGRSSARCEFQLPKNNPQISRTHVSLTYYRPTPHRSSSVASEETSSASRRVRFAEPEQRGELVVRCLGWNGCIANGVQLKKGQTYAWNGSDAILLDVCGWTAEVRVPVEEGDGDETEEEEWTADHTQVESSPFTAEVKQLPVTPAMTLPEVTVDAEEIIDVESRSGSPTPARGSGSLELATADNDTFSPDVEDGQVSAILPSSPPAAIEAFDEEDIEVYEDEDVRETSISLSEPTPMAIDGEPEAQESALTVLEDEEDVTIDSPAPGPMVLQERENEKEMREKKELEIKTEAIEKVTKPALSIDIETTAEHAGLSSPLSSPGLTAETDPELPDKIISALVFTAQKSTPLSSLLAELPSHTTASFIRSLSPFVAEIPRKGRDASGKRLESEFWYDIDSDPCEERRERFRPFVRGVRGARRVHKQYYWKPVVVKPSLYTGKVEKVPGGEEEGRKKKKRKL